MQVFSYELIRFSAAYFHLLALHWREITVPVTPALAG